MQSGVGQYALHAGCFRMLGAVWFAVTVGVGQPEDEDSFASVWSADRRRRVAAPRRSVAAAFQIGQDVPQPQRDMACDVLKQHAGRSIPPNKLKDGRPQVSGVVGSCSLSCLAEWLAWVSPAYPIDSNQDSCGKVSEITAPDRRFVHPPFLNRCTQTRDRECFPLDVAHGSRRSPHRLKSSVQSEVKSSDSATEAENRIHKLASSQNGISLGAAVAGLATTSG